MAIVSLGMAINDGVLYVLGGDDVGGVKMTLWRYRAADGTAFGSSPWLHSTLPVWNKPTTMNFNTQIAIGKDKIGIVGGNAANDLILTIITKSSGAVSSSTTIVNGINKGAADIAADGSDNFYVAWANTANTPNRINEFNSSGTSIWSITAHTRVNSVYYDRINSRLVIAGQAIDGGANSVAILSLADGTTSSAGNPSAAGSWLSIRGDGRGYYIIGRSATVARIDSAFVVDWTKTVTGFSGYKVEAADGQQTTNAAKTTYRVHRLAAVLDGDIVGFDQRGSVPVGSGSAALSAIAAVVFAAQNGRYVYFADGTNWVRYDPQTNAKETWTASAGTLPSTSGHTPRLIETWRGRTVLAGVIADPHNYFMSKVNDPRDWDYSAAVSAIMPVAGNQTNSTTGMPADVINCLIPYNDNIMIMGCDHTISRLDGDPMAGGQIQMMSNVIGMAWGRPYCRDTLGAIYFTSSRGAVYRMTPGGNFEEVSRQISKKLDNLDMAEHVVRMAWDDQQVGCHLFLTPLDRYRETIHYWFDARNESWWPDDFRKLDHNPKVAYLYDGDRPEDRRILLGSWDGYIRCFDVAANNDDGYAIRSHVIVGPFHTPERLGVYLRELQISLADDSDGLEYAILAGDNEEAALASSLVAHGKLVGGRNRSQPIYRFGHAVYLKLFNVKYDTHWSTESMIGVASIKGPVRRRVF